jgi:hypothetical protein
MSEQNELELSLDVIEVEKEKHVMKITFRHLQAPDRKLEFLSMQTVSNPKAAESLFNLLVETFQNGQNQK